MSTVRIIGPDADGLVWIHADAGNLQGAVSVSASSIAGRAFLALREPEATTAPAPLAVPPLPPPGVCDGCGGPKPPDVGYCWSCHHETLRRLDMGPCGAPKCPEHGIAPLATEGKGEVVCGTRVHVAGVCGESDFVCNLPRGHEGYHNRVAASPASRETGREG